MPDENHPETTTPPADSGARYGVGPSKGRANAVSAPGVAEELGHQGVPEGETVVGPLLPRAADEAALRRVARRRQRDDVQRTQRVDVRYSVAEKQAITAKARSMNIAGAHLVGAAVMAYLEGDLALPGQRTAIDDYIDELNALRAQVAKIGTNVNRIARVLNSGGQPHPVDTAVLSRAHRLLDTVRATVAAIDAASYSAVAGKAATE
ncbi:plasmid mobilization relaxosome protein MobC [Streptomyces sp. URMC 129]|uniref:plasmid mobilization relaxosome protein MobC n=1 Tax=Streptomyces sp. URMC 129 TaxID=3423407 RepID=UPI003F1AE1C4